MTMNRNASLTLTLMLSSLAVTAISSAEVPKGVVSKYVFENSQIFPGTSREYWVYIPQQYDGSKPACVYVNQDSVQFNAPAVFDTLIAAKEMPVTIGIFVTHGKVKAPNDQALMRYNRSYEYDGLGDNYARFLLEEFLPYVEKEHKLSLSHDGNDRCIGGSSSGAIAAFTAAWERPDAFSRVFSAIGTYVGLRGGNEYPTLIRKYEPKPIRIFLQDGSNDNNIYGGDWWIANQAMERSFVFSGYEVAHVWGDGGHNAKHGTEVFPDAMRFLWKDWPKPVQTGLGSPQMKDVLIPGESWQLVGDGYQFTEGITENAHGEIYFNDIPNNTTYKINSEGKPEVWKTDTKRANGQRFMPDGRMAQVVMDGQQVIALDAAGKSSVLAEGFRGNDVVALANGALYVTEPGWDNKTPSKIWYVSPTGEKKIVDDKGLIFANGITVSPDQTLLYVNDSRSHWIWSYQIQPDGSLKYKQKYYHLHVPDTAEYSGSDGMRTDRDGRLFVATKMGIQFCDQAGRVNGIIPTPNGKSSNLCFGGPEFNVLYVTCGEKVYKRKVKVTGAQHYLAPIKPAAPKL
jgi:gluconolactonase